MGLIGFAAEIVVMTGLVAAVVCNILLITSCEFFELGDRSTLGLYKYSINGGDCKDTSDKMEDAALNCAKVCAVLSLCFGLILVLAACIKQYLCPLPLAQKLIDLSGTLTQIFLALVYVAWRTELCDVVSCSWGKGSKYLLSTQICYLGASIFTRCMREPRYERKKNEPEPEPKEEPEPMEEPEPKKEVEVEKGLGSDDEDEEEQK